MTNTQQLLLIGGAGVLALVLLARPARAEAPPAYTPGMGPSPPQAGINYQSGKFQMFLSFDQLMKGVGDVVKAIQGGSKKGGDVKMTPPEAPAPGQPIIGSEVL